MSLWVIVRTFEGHRKIVNITAIGSLHHLQSLERKWDAVGFMFWRNKEMKMKEILLIRVTFIITITCFLFYKRWQQTRHFPITCYSFLLRVCLLRLSSVSSMMIVQEKWVVTKERSVLFGKLHKQNISVCDAQASLLSKWLAYTSNILLKNA